MITVSITESVTDFSASTVILSGVAKLFGRLAGLRPFFIAVVSMSARRSSPSHCSIASHDCIIQVAFNDLA